MAQTVLHTSKDVVHVDMQTAAALQVDEWHLEQQEVGCLPARAW